MAGPTHKVGDTSVRAAPSSAPQAKPSAPPTASSPSWTDTVAFKGDLRTRYEYINEDAADARSRGRLRLRLGVLAQPLERVQVGAGLATGSGGQRSANQSFDETFSAKDINLDYAYMRYEFAPGTSAVAGKFKFKDYLWAPTDMMWDSDINPEGFSARSGVATPWGEIFAQGGIWVLEEEGGSSDDPYLAYGQLGHTWQADPWFASLSLAGYAFSNIESLAALSAHEGSNTDSKLSSLNLAAELGSQVGPGKASVLGEYIDNIETASAGDVAWAIGSKYEWNKWKLRYVYTDIEANSIPDFLPDSDRFDGLTGIRGHEFEVQYALFANVSLVLDYYHVKDTATNVDQDLLQADINVKF